MNSLSFGLLTAILEHMSFEEVLVYAKSKGFTSLELACWPQQKEKRRYAGTSHLDVTELNDEYIAYIKSKLKEYNLEISSLGYYPNPLDPNQEASEIAINHIYQLINASHRLGINMVTTFIGRNKYLSQQENLDLFEKVWTPIIAFAEEKKVKIAIENCPMWFTYDEYPGGLNLATSPEMFEEIFKRISSPYFGLNFDPSHFVWQHMDYTKVLDTYQERIFHVHIKDVKIDLDKLNYYGILVPPLKYMAPRLPGLGDIDWKKFILKLNEINYRGHYIIEFEDKLFELSFDKINQGIDQTLTFLKSL
jgi:sugar phosphate isomerase/epimerase